MKTLARNYCILLAALILTLLCLSGCAEGGFAAADEDDSFAILETYAEYDDETLDSSMKLAELLTDSWYGDGYAATDSDELGWLLDYVISAHTQDGRSAFVFHIPGSAGMSQLDFILLTTKDYGKTWDPGDGVYHIAGDIAQITINEDYIYMIMDSATYGNSCVLMSDDFGVTFRRITADKVTPAEYRTRMSELYGVYMRIINVERDDDIVLEYYCENYFEDMSSDDTFDYESSVMSDEKRTIMILHSDAHFSEVKTLYAEMS